ncbi:MAG: hypothetical protein AAF688_01155 [Bacteroidota bacterium]
MKRTLKYFTALSLFLIGYTGFSQSEKDKKIMADAEDAKATMVEKDSEIADFFSKSAGYVIFPNVGKGGLIIGGASGNGIVYENGVAVGSADLKKLSVGLQAGGQAIVEVIFFETLDDLNDFKQGDFEFAAGISAVVLKEGKAKGIKYRDGVAVVAMPKAGLMAEASVGGQKFDYESF